MSATDFHREILNPLFPRTILKRLELAALRNCLETRPAVPDIIPHGRVLEWCAVASCSLRYCHTIWQAVMRGSRSTMFSLIRLIHCTLYNWIYYALNCGHDRSKSECISISKGWMPFLQQLQPEPGTRTLSATSLPLSHQMLSYNVHQLSWM